MIEFNATFLIAMLSFVVFIFIMNAIFYRPLLRMIQKREDYIQQNYSQAKAADSKADECKNTRIEKYQAAKEKCRLDIANSVDDAQKAAFKEIQLAKTSALIDIQLKKEELLSKVDDMQKTVNDNVVDNLSDYISAKITGNKV